MGPASGLWRHRGLDLPAVHGWLRRRGLGQHGSGLAGRRAKPRLGRQPQRRAGRRHDLSMEGSGRYKKKDGPVTSSLYQAPEEPAPAATDAATPAKGSPPTRLRISPRKRLPPTPAVGAARRRDAALPRLKRISGAMSGFSGSSGSGAGASGAGGARSRVSARKKPTRA